MIYEGEGYLAHHGIKGQKWGDRNGPPYPLSKEQKSRYELLRRKRTARNLQKELNRKHRTARELDRDIDLTKTAIAEDDEIISYNKKVIAEKEAQGKKARYRKAVTRWSEKSKADYTKQLKEATAQRVMVKKEIDSLEKYLKDNGYNVSLESKVVAISPSGKEGGRAFIYAGLFGPQAVKYEAVKKRKVKG